MQKRYINANELLNCITNKRAVIAHDRWVDGYNAAISSVKSIVRTCQTADVQEVIHGEWIVDGFDDTYLCYTAYCSNCEIELDMKFDGDKPYVDLNTAYCPCCGTKMNGWREEYE